MSNHLKNSTSPYLLQHAENPVDWYPWCGEAFEKAKKEDKPVFLSIGYSTCHWCHVMAHESFEDAVTAEILNQYFVSIKVDREERPDIDSVYMSVCQAFTGSGGWPMSIFMTWDKKPFLAGTYFPVRPRYGMPGFSDLLHAVARQWSSKREELLHSADQIIAHLKSSESAQETANCGDTCLFEKAVKMFSDSFDRTYGGFGDAPKFPVPHNLLFLALYAKLEDKPEVLEMVEKTLTQMRKGGIFDHIGYGFSRYSTDKYFLAPHFEKMLYDNALLIIAYASVYQITKKREYLDTAQKTAQYVLHEMTSPGGGFYSAQDADSEGTEGKYYTFTLAEIMDVLGEEKGKKFSAAFDITAHGNFEGVNILNRLKSNHLRSNDLKSNDLKSNHLKRSNLKPDNPENDIANSEFDEEIKLLYSYRKKRFSLHLDDKILLSWNALMIAALSVLYRVSQDEKYLRAAKDAQRFVEKHLSDGLQLFTSWRGGIRSEKGFLDDYACYIAALIELYHSTLDGEYLEKAKNFCREAVRRFFDDENGGFYLSDSDNTELFMNPKETYDGAVPSGNSVMFYNLVRLCQLTEYDLTESKSLQSELPKLAEMQAQYLSAQAQDYLMGHSMFLLAKLIDDNPPKHIVIALKKASDLEEIKRNLPLLANIIIVSEGKQYPLLNDRTTFYVCKNHVCFAPVNTLEGRIKR